MLCISIIVTFGVIACIIFKFTKRITEPIHDLTDFTEQLTKATDFQDKKKIIEVLKEKPFFESCVPLKKKEKIGIVKDSDGSDDNEDGGNAQLI